MKKKIFLSAIFLIAMVLISCKPEKKEWERFFGYSPADIVGEYGFSGASDAFAGLLESEEGILCADAVVNVSSPTAQTVNFSVNCPDHNFQKGFLGRPSLNANAFNVMMDGGWSNLKRFNLYADVMKIEQGIIRLIGFVNEDHYERVYNNNTQVYDTVYDYSVKRYFDVIKN